MKQLIEDAIERLMQCRIELEKGNQINEATLYEVQMQLYKALDVLATLPEPAINLVNYIPYQLCPKCNGDGNLGRFNSPPFMSTGWPPICDVCNGSKIIPMHTLSHLEAKEGRG